MVKINGVNATSTMEQKKEKTPTLNQILDMMENNYQSINSKQNTDNNFNSREIQNNFLRQKNSYNIFNNRFDGNIHNNNYNNSNFDNFNVQSQHFDTQTNNSQNIDAQSIQNKNPFDDKSSLLMSILPAMLSQNKTASSLGKQKDILIKELLKNTQNPMLTKLFELLPKLTTNNFSETQNSQDNNETKKIEPKIDTFRRTDDIENL